MGKHYKSVLDLLYEGSTNQLTDQLAAVTASVIGGAVMPGDDITGRLGANSLQSVRILRKFEKATGVAIPLTAFQQAKTVADMVALMQGRFKGSTAAYT